MLPLIPILTGGILKLTQDEKDMDNATTPAMKKGGFELRNWVCLWPSGFLWASFGQSASSHWHGGHLDASIFQLFCWQKLCISPVSSLLDHIATTPAAWSWGEFRALGWRDSCGQSAEGRTSCDSWWVARGMLCFQKPCRKSLRHVQRLKDI